MLFKKPLPLTPAHPSWLRWVGMMARCYRRNTPGWLNYGKRGITVCERWHDYRSYLSDVGAPPAKDQQLDRIDVEKGYSPDNVQWVTVEKNARNKRNTVRVQWEGKEVPLIDLADAHGLKPATVYARLRKGWSVEQCVGEEVPPPRLSPEGKIAVISACKRRGPPSEQHKEALRKSLAKARETLAAKRMLTTPRNSCAALADKRPPKNTPTRQSLINDVRGKTFGAVTFVEPLGQSDKNGNALWRCQCSACGKEASLVAKNFIAGKAKSCGCQRYSSPARLKHLRENHPRLSHGETRTPTYVSWIVMRRRFKESVCLAWNNYETFRIEMGEKPEGLCLRRKDPEKPFSKDNCEWGKKGPYQR